VALVALGTWHLALGTWQLGNLALWHLPGTLVVRERVRDTPHDNSQCMIFLLLGQDSQKTVKSKKSNT